MKIAIIGASKNREKYSNKAVRAYKSENHVVFPVNPSERKIEGLTCYCNVSQIPLDVEIASMYLPPEIGIKVVDDIINKGIKKVYLNPGSESKELIELLRINNIKVCQVCSIKELGLDPRNI